MERNQAHIEKVVSISPIPKADRIEVATVLGWECVVKKGVFKPGDYCVYIEIDSIVPPWAEFEFLKDRKYRVRTIKLRGQVSQGLALPIDGEIAQKVGKLNEGKDVSMVLEIEKYDPQLIAERKAQAEEMSRKSKNKVFMFFMSFWIFRKVYFWIFGPKPKMLFPSWIAKTDETRVQARPSKFLRPIDGQKYYVTEKIDGQSVTVFYKPNEKKKMRYGICSRNIRLNPDCNGNWQNVCKKYDLETKLKSACINMYPGGIAVQGEIIGPNIQGNKYRETSLKLYVFSMFDIAKGKYLNWEHVQEMAKYFEINTVPLLDNDFNLEQYGEFTEQIMEDGCTMRQYSPAKILKYAEGMSILPGREDVIREGVVIRTHDQSVSFKAINNVFLLNEKD